MWVLKTRYKLAWPLLLTGICQASAGTLSLAKVPLTTSSSVKPNVMMLVDNSGSMNSMIYPKSFYDEVAAGTLNPATQDTWQYCSYYNYMYNSYYNTYQYYCSNWQPISNQASNINHSSFIRVPYSSCPAGYSDFRKGNGASTCFKLPDPETYTRYSGEHLNYLFNKYPGGTDFTQSTGTDADGNLTYRTPQDTRIQVAKDVGTEVLKTAGMRFGLARFQRTSNNSGHGAIIDHGCADRASTDTTLATTLEGYTANTSTPLAEALYEITRYFRGMSSYYSSRTYTSPIQYRCQKNFTVAITDGFPTNDGDFDSSDADVPVGKTLSDWDGLHPATTASQYPNFPQYSDGFASGSSGAEGGTLYMDDIAKFAWDTDFRKTGNDLSGLPFNDAAFKTQNMYTYTVGFATANQMLEDAAEYGKGEYYTANTKDELITALQGALDDISKKSGSSSSAAASTGRVQAGSQVFQARFNSTDWSGELLAYNIDTTVGSATYGRLLTNGSGPGGSEKDFGKLIPSWNGRTIITNIQRGTNQLGKRFRWNTFNASERSALFDDDQATLQYLRGRENLDQSIYRKRSSLLGDIVHSSPYYVGPPSARYSEASYQTFMADNKNRTPIIYVGANDGMLHGFDATTGREELAYIPGSLLPKLKDLKDPGYAHDYYVDGSPTIVDAYDGSKWRSVLVGGLSGGGQSIYALDVTDPTDFTESKANQVFMWEFTDQNHSDLGYTYGQPTIVKLNDDMWYAVFGNGYNNTQPDGTVSTSGDAVLYIVNLWTGALVKAISTNVGMDEDPQGLDRPNGLSTVTPVDINNDGKSDLVYAGDLFGNVWRFDLTATSSASWALGHKLFRACSSNSCSASTSQPITTPVTVGRGKGGVGYMVYFGTGKHLEVGDNNGANGGRQSFYGIWDKDAGAEVTRNRLLAQTITAETAFTVDDKKGTEDTSDDEINAKEVALRKTSNNQPTNHLGWYLDLVPPAGERGERLISPPVLRAGRIYYVTNIPANDPCTPGGDSWFMSQDALTGGRLADTYDIDNDGSYSTDDRKFGGDAATGIKVPSGATGVTFITGQGDNAIMSTNDGVQDTPVNGGGSIDRQSWQRLNR